MLRSIAPDPGKTRAQLGMLEPLTLDGYTLCLDAQPALINPTRRDMQHGARTGSPTIASPGL